MRKLEPDLVFEIDGGLYVFDVKYKAFDSQFGVRIFTYIGQYGNVAPIKGCGFIYPISEERWASLNLERTQGGNFRYYSPARTRDTVSGAFSEIPDNTYLDFNRQMKEQCRMFIDTIYSKILNK